MSLDTQIFQMIFLLVSKHILLLKGTKIFFAIFMLEFLEICPFEKIMAEYDKNYLIKNFLLKNLLKKQIF